MPKKTTKKKVVAKKKAAKKVAKPKAKPAKKAAKATAKKAAKKKPASTSKAAAKPKAGPRFPIVGKKTHFHELEMRGKGKSRKMSKSFLNKQQEKLIELRQHILEQMQGVAQDSLRSKSDSAGSAFGMHQADAGSDAYEKDFALSLLSQEQDALYEIEQAIKRIDNGTYGICEMSGDQIPTARLEAIPYARFTATCQDQMEKEMKNRGLWETNAQFMNASDNFFEESDSSDDDDRSTAKD